MIHRLRWDSPAPDDVATVRGRIFGHLDRHGDPGPAFATAVTEVLSNAAEASVRATDSAQVAIEITHDRLAVTNPALGPVPPTPEIRPHDRPDGRGLAFIAALWPDTAWTFGDGHVTATLQLPPGEER